MSSLLPKACENCRVRKIRCDKTSPCSSCVVANLQCGPQASAQGQPIRPATNPPSSTAIQQLEERVRLLEQALRQQSIASTPNDSIRSSSLDFLPSTSINAENATLFEGESSFVSQALSASRSADASYSRSAKSAALSHSPSAISTSGLSIEYGTTSISYADFLLNGRKLPDRFPQMRLPRADITLHLLNTFRNRPSLAYLIYGFGDTSYLESLASNAYFPTKAMSLGALTTMHGLFYVLAKDFKFDTNLPVPQNFNLQSFSDQCLTNFCLGLESHELMVVPSIDNVRALEIGLLRATEESKALLAWTLMSTASRHLVNLGYHRRSTYDKHNFQEAEAIRRLFWRIYCHDRNMSLNLGRIPCIREDDVDVDLFNLPADQRLAPWDEVHLQFVQLARLQGFIYEELYSLSAAQRPLDQRQSNACKLDFVIREWRGGFSWIAKDNTYAADLFNAFYNPIDVRYNALLANVLLAAGRQDSTLNISVKCYEASRACLESHLYWFPAVKAYKDGLLIHGYASYALFYTTLTPLIVMFLHGVSQCNAADIELLRQFRDSLAEEQSGHSISRHLKGTERIVTVCSSFIRIAEEKLQQSPIPMPPLTLPNPDYYAAVVDVDTFFNAQSNSQTAMAQQFGMSFGNDFMPLTATSSEAQSDSMSAFLSGWINEHQLPDVQGMEWNL